MEPWMWIVIAIVALIIIALVVIAIRKNSATAKRDRAAELREQAERNDLAVRERQAAAAKTQADAQAAEAEAKRRAAEAQEQAVKSERLAEQAQDRSAAYQEARNERDDLLRQADEVDPDVRDGQPSAHAAGRGQGNDDSREAQPQGVQRPTAGQPQPVGDRDGDGRYGMTERAHDKVDDVRGRRDTDRDGRRG